MILVISSDLIIREIMMSSVGLMNVLCNKCKYWLQPYYCSCPPFCKYQCMMVGDPLHMITIPLRSCTMPIRIPWICLGSAKVNRKMTKVDQSRSNLATEVQANLAVWVKHRQTSAKLGRRGPSFGQFWPMQCWSNFDRTSAPGAQLRLIVL